MKQCISTVNIPDDNIRSFIDDSIRHVLRRLENKNNPLKKWRFENQVTGNQVADKLHIDSRRYNKIELGKIKPKHNEQESISNLCGTEILNWIMDSFQNKK
jgi:DNA-binding XRE family transcriptional regulator